MKRRRLLYVPGLISALVLPVLLIFFDLRRPAELKALNLHLPSDEPANMGRFTRGNVEETLKDKDVLTLYLDRGHYYGDPDKAAYIDYAARDLVSNEIRRLKFTHDTTKILEIRLTAENTYGDFVWLNN